MKLFSIRQPLPITTGPLMRLFVTMVPVSMHSVLNHALIVDVPFNASLAP